MTRTVAGRSLDCARISPSTGKLSLSTQQKMSACFYSGKGKAANGEG